MQVAGYERDRKNDQRIDGADENDQRENEGSENNAAATVPVGFFMYQQQKYLKELERKIMRHLQLV